MTRSEKEEDIIEYRSLLQQYRNATTTKERMEIDSKLIDLEQKGDYI